MKYRNSVFVVCLSLMLSACATTEPYNKDYETRNVALIKDTIFDPIFSIKTKSATVKKIDGKETKYTSTSNEVTAGEHELFTACTYYETSTLFYDNEHPLKVNVEKGHTYKLIPILIADNNTRKITCISKLQDLTK